MSEVFREAVRRVNQTESGAAWLTDRHSMNCMTSSCANRTAPCWKANEAVQALLFKTKVDINEITGEQDLADIPEVTAVFERLAVEIIKLAKNRHEELMKG